MTDFNATFSAANETVFQGMAAASTFLAPALAPLAPYNPQPVFQSAWEAMCGRFTEYQIATTGSLMVQVFFYFMTAMPGFIFQFMAIMKAYKVQKGKQHSLHEQFICLRRVMFSKTFIYVRTHHTREQHDQTMRSEVIS